MGAKGVARAGEYVCGERSETRERRLKEKKMKKRVDTRKVVRAKYGPRCIKSRKKQRERDRRENAQGEEKKKGGGGAPPPRSFPDGLPRQSGR